MELQSNKLPLPTTHWTEIASASQHRQDKGREALDRLLRRYQGALLAHLSIKFRVPEDVAEDLWQSFVAEKVLEKELLAQANPARGRFRTFLLNAVDRFVISRQRKDRAQKRSPEAGFVALDELAPNDEPHHVDTAADRTEVLWAQEVIAAALLNMRNECENSKRLDIWGVFDGRILAAVLEEAPETDYGELIRRFGFKSPSHAFNALNTAKRMFKRHLQAVVGEYARGDKEVEEELGELKKRLLRAG
jgi:DNA-directed RNA polymerase specialized sigma24 family protein